jgi:uroporphyrinogen decarboxylase
MNCKERVFCALDLKKPDRVPILEWAIDPGLREKMFPGKDYLYFIDRMGYDALATKVNYIKKDLGNNRYLDEWGITRVFTTESTYFPVDGPLHKNMDLSKLKVPSADLPERYNELEHLVRNRTDKPVIFLMDDVFIYPTYVRGMENLMMDFYDDPQFAQELMGIFTEYACNIAKNAVELGADIIVICDDYAFNSGLLFSKDIFQRFIKPNLKKVADTVRKAGAYCVKHTDGNITSIIEDLIDCGIQGIHPFDPLAGMELSVVKKNHGEKVCLIGNVDCSNLLSFGSPDEVEEAVKKCIMEASENGGYIMQSSNSIHSGVNPENLIRMVEACKKYGVYV